MIYNPSSVVLKIYDLGKLVGFSQIRIENKKKLNLYSKCISNSKVLLQLVSCNSGRGKGGQACIKVFGAWHPKKVPGNARKGFA